MNEKRIEKIMVEMRKNNLFQMIVSDPMNIFYLTGNMVEAGERFLALYINTDGKKVLFLNELFPQEKLDIETVWYKDTENPVKMIAEYIKNEPIGVDRNLRAGFLLELMEITGVKFIDSSYIMDYTRQIKDEDEQEKMRISSRINDKVMEEIIPFVNKGLREEELDKKIRELYKKHGCEGVSFSPIASYGVNGADPHHMPDESTAEYGDSVVIDIGGMKDGYASDMTRTVFLGEVSDKKREVYEIVKEANRRGIEAAKPGNRMMDVDLAARNYIEEMGYGKYFTHRTGHSIGMEDHEYGDVSFINDDIIRPGQCFSVEPGIYIKEENFGVRIEDLVLITEDGCEVLNKVTRELIVLPFE